MIKKASYSILTVKAVIRCGLMWSKLNHRNINVSANCKGDYEIRLDYRYKIRVPQDGMGFLEEASINETWQKKPWDDTNLGEIHETAWD